MRYYTILPHTIQIVCGRKMMNENKKRQEALRLLAFLESFVLAIAIWFSGNRQGQRHLL